jgi:hypothetical protein
MEDNKFQKWATVISVGIMIIVGLGGILAWIHRLNSGLQDRAVESHYAAIVGLPFVAAAAFIVITFFRQAAGPIKIKMAGFELEGAGGPVLLWVTCYLAMAFSIWLLWGLGS